MRNLLLLVHPATPLVLWGIANGGGLLSSLSDRLPEGWGVPGWVEAAAEPGEPGRALGAADPADGDDAAALERQLQMMGGDPRAARVTRLAQPIVQLVCQVVFTLLLGCWYKSWVTDKRTECKNPVQGSGLDFSLGDWKYGTFSCFDNIDYCLYGCCCFNLRVADTYQAAGVGQFWPVVLFIMVMIVVMTVGQALVTYILTEVVEADVPPVPFMYWVVGIIMACYFANKRQAMKAKMMGDGGDPGGMLNDFICWWCCSCCTAIQEARQVDEINNVRVSCFFRITEENMAGVPVQVVGSAVAKP